MAFKVSNDGVPVELSNGVTAVVKRLKPSQREKCATVARLTDGDTASAFRFAGYVTRSCVIELKDSTGTSVAKFEHDRVLGKLLAVDVYDELTDDDIAAINAKAMETAGDDAEKKPTGSPT